MSLQHFVPRFLLSQFSIDAQLAGRKQKPIAVLDLKTGKVFTTGVMGVAATHNFYDFVTPSGDDDLSIDPLLTNIERRTAPSWRKLAQTQRVADLTVSEREALALFILTLFVRGPATRSDISGVPGLILNALEQRGDDVSPEFRDWLTTTRDADVNVHASSIVHVAQHFKTIAGRTWILFSPPAGRHFCTSDSPVTQFNETDTGAVGSGGLLTRGACLQVAVSPTLLLVMADGDPYGLKEVDRLVMLDDQGILRYNWMLARFAERYLYAASRVDFAGVPTEVWQPGPRVTVL
jgi:hypothetical protein